MGAASRRKPRSMAATDASASTAAMSTAPPRSPLVAHPRRPNRLLLAASIIAFAVWQIFLLLLTTFG